MLAYVYFIVSFFVCVKFETESIKENEQTQQSRDFYSFFFNVKTSQVQVSSF